MRRGMVPTKMLMTLLMVTDDSDDALDADADANEWPGTSKSFVNVPLGFPDVTRTQQLIVR